MKKSYQIFSVDQSFLQVAATPLLPPTFTLPVDNQGLLRTDNPVITGKAAPRAAVTLFADGKVIGTGKADDAGSWAILADSLQAGAHNFAASQSLADGSTSVASQTVTATVALSNAGLKFAIASLSQVGVTADRVFLQNMLDDTAARLSEIIDANLTISVDVTVQDLGGAAGSAGAAWLGVDPNGTPKIGKAVLNLGAQYPSLYSQTDYNGPYVFTHEMMHVLGFNSGVPAFHKFIEVRTDGAYFVGPNTVALNGGPVKLDGSHSHLIGDGDLMGPGGLNLDSPGYDAHSQYAPYSQLNIAMLKDIGWATKPVLVSADGHTFIAGSGRAGFDQITGTNGVDTFYLDQSRSSLTGKWTDGKYVLSNISDGSSHSLAGIERIKFADVSVAIDIDGTGGQVYRLYQAVFGRTPDKQGLGFWMEAMDDGMSLASVADEFAKSKEFYTIYGSAPTSEEVISRLYNNVLHRAPEAEGFEFWNNNLKNNPGLIEEIVVGFSESAENQLQLVPIIGNGFEYLPWA